MMVARVWRKHGLKPHRIERYMASNDPDFETKAADIIGLYLNPPAHAAVSASMRKRPFRPWIARIRYAHCRRGAPSGTALSTTGMALCPCTPPSIQKQVKSGQDRQRHTSAEFVAFLTDIVINQPRGKEIHVIADNLSAHKSAPVKEFLETHPKVHLHFTPTYSSWLNQVELVV